MKTGVELTAIERQEQIEKHGRTIEKDVAENTDFQLVKVARFLTEEDGLIKSLVNPVEEYCPQNWDKTLFKKMIDKPYKERLIIAGALICAEIDRLQAIEK